MLALPAKCQADEIPQNPNFKAQIALNPNDLGSTGLALRVKILCNRRLEFHWGSRGGKIGTLRPPGRDRLGELISAGKLADLGLDDGSAFLHARNTLELEGAV